MDKVFVYGTMKKGQPTHSWLQRDDGNGQAILVGKAATAETWPLVTAGKYNAPFLLNLRGTGKIVKGDIFMVDSKRLGTMDKLEGHPDVYERVMIDIKMINEEGLQSGETISAWCYMINNYVPELLEKEFIDDYDAHVKHKIINFEEAAVSEYWDGVIRKA